jgi:hypothetical protein
MKKIYHWRFLSGDTLGTDGRFAGRRFIAPKAFGPQENHPGEQE